MLLHWRWGGVLATPFLMVYFTSCWRRIMFTAKLLLIACLVLGGAVLLRPQGFDTLVTALGRMTFFPAFVAALGLLRAAADASHTVDAAGRMLVSQTPSRRYAALTLGGHIFGILLNIGGLALLLDMTRRANTFASASGNARVVAVRERRMTLAVMRGFAAIALWSPLGLALNLILASMPDVAWTQVAPYGFVGACAFMGLGFVFDRLGNPPPRQVSPSEPVKNGAGAVAAMAGHIVALSSLALTAELLTHWSFQAILINLVPLYALMWLLAGALRRGDPPVRSALTALRDQGIARWPNFANEISVFAASGLLGVVIADLAPRGALQAALMSTPLPPGGFAAALALVVFSLGFLGINPMISASILAGTLSTLTVPGLSHATIVLALAAGWACVIGVAPLMSSLVITAGVIGRRTGEVGLKWNGRFGLLAITLTMLTLLVAQI